MRDAPECFELDVAPLQQIANRMCREHLWREALERRLRCGRLRAVFTELGRVTIAVRVGPRATRAVEAVLLVQLEQCVHRAADAHLLETEMRGFIDGVEACCGCVTSVVSGAVGLEWRLSSIDAVGKMRVRIGGLGLLRLVGRAVLVVLMKMHA